MSDMNYEIGISLKNAIKDLKKFQRIADKFNKKLAKDQKSGRKIESENTRHLVSEKRKQGKASQSALADMLRQEEKLGKEKSKQLAKEKAQQKRFNTWRKVQQRKLVDAQLTSHQKMEIKRVLASKKSEDVIRSEYDETLRKFRVNKRKEVDAAKRANKLKVANEKAHTDRMGKIRSSGLVIAQAAIAAVTGAGALVGGGASQYADDRANAANAGMDTKEFQKQAFQVNQATTIGNEKFADITKTANERKGSAMFLEKGKDGEFKGADMGANDLINSMQQRLGKSLDLSQAKDLLNQGGKTGIEGLMSMRDQMDSLGLSMEDQSFLMESFASDSWNLTEQFKRNSKAAKQAEKDFDRLGLGIQNLEAVDRITNKFKGMWGVLKAAPMEAFESFSSALSPETSAMLQKITERMVDLSRVIGESLANALNWLAPHIEKLLPLLDKLAPLFSYIADQVGVSLSLLGDIFGVTVDTLSGTIEAIRLLFSGDLVGAFDKMKDTITGVFTGIQAALKGAILGLLENVIDFMPDALIPDSVKEMVKGAKAPTVTTPNTTTPKSVATAPPTPQSVTVDTGRSEVVVHSTLNLDGNQVARSVTRTEQFKQQAKFYGSYAAGGNR